MDLENRLFTFAGLINYNHDFIVGFYTVLCALITVFVSRLAVL